MAAATLATNLAAGHHDHHAAATDPLLLRATSLHHLCISRGATTISIFSAAHANQNSAQLLAAVPSPLHQQRSATTSAPDLLATVSPAAAIAQAPFQPWQTHRRTISKTATTSASTPPARTTRIFFFLVQSPPQNTITAPDRRRRVRRKTEQPPSRGREKSVRVKP